MASAAATAHRVRRIALAVRGVRDGRAALAWRHAVRGALDDELLPALGDAFDAAALQQRLGERTLHLPRLAVRIEVSDPRLIGESLRRAVEAALRDAVAARDEPGGVLRTPAERTEQALRHFLLSGRLPWPEDERDRVAALIAELRALAREWFERLLVDAADPAPWLERRIARSASALSRWAALIDLGSPGRGAPPAAIPDAARDGWPGSDAPIDDVAGSAVPIAASARAAWLWRRLASARAAGGHPAGERGPIGEPKAAAPAATLLDPERRPMPAAPAGGVSRRRQAPRDVAAMTAPQLDPNVESPEEPTTTWLAHDAGMVLLHPYLPTLLGAIGALAERDDAPARIRAEALPRACALLHWLVSGRDEVHEFELTLCKLLLGVAPDAPLLLTAEATRLSDAMRDEGRALLDALIAHWPALGSTGIDSLRVAFLARDGLLSRRDGGWQLHVAHEAYDVLLSRLPWSIGLVRLPWMREPMHVQWGTA
jgi:hypothetical protein